MTARRLGVAAALVRGRLVPGDVEVVDDRVARVGLPAAPGGRVAAPGLVDLQVNGFDGVDVMTADRDALVRLSCSLRDHGVTSWLPTLITDDPGRTDRALDVLAGAVRSWSATDGARPLGVHLEGPFLAPGRLGTHPEEFRRDPDPDLLDSWLRRGPVATVTMAPELPGGLEMVSDLARRGVLVSLGHSDATAEQAHAAFESGARSVTHLFNAMSPLGHRNPGLAGAALARPDVTVQLIVDGHHLAAEVVRLAWAAAPGRIVLVTDATEAAAREEGAYALAGQAVEVRGGAVRNGSGALAGSALTLDGAVRNACALGLEPAEVLAAASESPGRLLGPGPGRPEVGRLEPGARADVVVLEDDLTVRETWVEGRPEQARTRGEGTR